jgi:hypothetical protein
MGEWSPECVAVRWVGGATGPAVGAKFEGDNRFTRLGVTLKKWTTTSEVTACVPGEVFDFVTEGYTTWRYRFEPVGTGTRLTETYEYKASAGAQRFLYDVVMRRPAVMVKDMQRTLDRIKQTLESS